MTQFLAPVVGDAEEELERSLRPHDLSDFVGQERVKEQLVDRARRCAGARRGPRPRAARRAAGARQDVAGADRAQRARGRDPAGRRARARAQGRHRGDPHLARAARRALRRRDPSPEPRRRGDPLPGARGLSPRHHRRAGPGRAHADTRPAAVHADRRDDADGTSDDAAARPVRADLPARPLYARRAGRDRPPFGRDPRGRDRRRRSRAGRRALSWHAADREPDPAQGPRRRRGSPPGQGDDGDRRGVADPARGRRCGARAVRPRAASVRHREVRRRPRRPVDAGRRARRGAGDDRGRLRAVLAPARLPPADAAWPNRHRSRARPPRCALGHVAGCSKVRADGHHGDPCRCCRRLGRRHRPVRASPGRRQPVRALRRKRTRRRLGRPDRDRE